MTCILKIGYDAAKKNEMLNISRGNSNEIDVPEKHMKRETVCMHVCHTLGTFAFCAGKCILTNTEIRICSPQNSICSCICIMDISVVHNLTHTRPTMPCIFTQTLLTIFSLCFILYVYLPDAHSYTYVCGELLTLCACTGGLR